MESSSDLLYKINNINMENKSLATVDIKSLYTNIPVNKCIERLEIHHKKTKITLAIHKVIQICTVCPKQYFVNVTIFFYQQK